MRSVVGICIVYFVFCMQNVYSAKTALDTSFDLKYNQLSQVLREQCIQPFVGADSPTTCLSFLRNAWCIDFPGIPTDIRQDPITQRIKILGCRKDPLPVDFITVWSRFPKSRVASMSLVAMATYGISRGYRKTGGLLCASLGLAWGTLLYLKRFMIFYKIMVCNGNGTIESAFIHEWVPIFPSRLYFGTDLNTIEMWHSVYMLIRGNLGRTTYRRPDSQSIFTGIRPSRTGAQIVDTPAELAVYRAQVSREPLLDDNTDGYACLSDRITRESEAVLAWYCKSTIITEDICSLEFSTIAKLRRGGVSRGVQLTANASGHMSLAIYQLNVDNTVSIVNRIWLPLSYRVTPIAQWTTDDCSYALLTINKQTVAVKIPHICSGITLKQDYVLRKLMQAGNQDPLSERLKRNLRTFPKALIGED